MSNSAGFRGSALLAPLLLLLAALLAAPAPGRAADEEGCLGCHGLEGFVASRGGRPRPLAIVPERFEVSAHGPLGCRDCHADIASIPHPEASLDVGCGLACHVGGREGKGYSHEALYWEYTASVHGSQKTRKITCLFCHPSPGIAAETERRDKLLEVRRCAACHHGTPKVLAWFNDVHYRALARGDQRAPSCPDCHTDHRVWPPEAKESSVNPRRLPDTCAKGALGGSPGRECHGALPESAVRGAGMSPLLLGSARRGTVPGLFTFLFGAMLLGLVARAGLGFLRWR